MDESVPIALSTRQVTTAFGNFAVEPTTGKPRPPAAEAVQLSALHQSPSWTSLFHV